MLVKKNRGFKKKYVYGGYGMFDTIMNLLTSTATKDVATKIAQNAAVSAGTKLSEKGINKLFSPKSKEILTPDSRQILSKYNIKIQDFVKGDGVKIIS